MMNDFYASEFRKLQQVFYETLGSLQYLAGISETKNNYISKRDQKIYLELYNEIVEKMEKVGLKIP